MRTARQVFLTKGDLSNGVRDASNRPGGSWVPMHDLPDAPSRAELVWTLIAIATFSLVAHFALPLVA